MTRADGGPRRQAGRLRGPAGVAWKVVLDAQRLELLALERLAPDQAVDDGPLLLRRLVLFEVSAHASADEWNATDRVVLLASQPGLLVLSEPLAGTLP